MADSVATIPLNGTYGDGNRFNVTFTNISDGTGESAVTKITLANFATEVDGGAVPTGLLIEQIWYDISGMVVKIYADGGTPALKMMLGSNNSSNAGHFDFRESLGGIVLRNTGSNGGGLAFTTVGAAANDHYSITMSLKILP